jgi:antitoxin ChpS
MSKGNVPYKLAELIAQCDPDSPMPPELLEWEQAESIGLERDVVAGQRRPNVLIHREL